MHLDDFLDNSNNKYICDNNEAHLYTMSLNSRRHNTINLARYLTSQERSKATSFHTKELAENYIIANATLKQVLSRYTKTSALDIDFLIGRYGKPYLKNNQKKIEFNVSHSKDMLCIVVTSNEEVGVDIEFKDINININELQSLVLHPQENNYIHSLESTVEKIDYFYNLWTIKESIVKAIGCGLSYPINQINIIDAMLNIKQSDIIKTAYSNREHKLFFLSSMTPNRFLNIDSSYSCAIVTRCTRKKIVHLGFDTVL